MCLAALLYEQFLPIREWRCQDIDQVLLHGDHFFLSSELLDKSASIRSSLLPRILKVGVQILCGPRPT